MESIHATYGHIIQPVPSEQYWSNTNYLKTEAPIIKRPIGRPKVHNKRRDPVEDLINGDKLKKSFKAETSQPVPPATIMNAEVAFRPPAQVAPGAGASKTFRAKQPVRRQLTRNSPPPSEPPTTSQVEGPSKETLAAASTSTQRKFILVCKFCLFHKAHNLLIFHSFIVISLAQMKDYMH
ncbi:hypothetical protein PIB30_086628 [Stylosanthes scabra]|uniref:Uncharacterized protein n=1 Tax=Stylosanthes scabra TaxID=79078 RepID=A0ABU6XQK2_9FABA|nr:hypothetical protein [Stylosanthes scabra]